MRRVDRSMLDEPSVPPALYKDVESISSPLEGPDDLDRLLERIGDARFVLLGEASHGTSEYYEWRAEISRRLIREKGFSFLAVEGDWPDCYRLNRYIKRLPDSGQSARAVLRTFERWPTWMWANEEIAALAEWLREHNGELAEDRRVGFYGLDVYSLWDSLYAILDYLRRIDPQALPAALRAFRCFEPYGEDVQEYARATVRFVPASCEDEVVELLGDLRAKAAAYSEDGREAYFAAEQNSLVLRNAEAYYRAMVRGGPGSWNIRDRHMTETLARLTSHHGPHAKAIVWEHNTHVGDARYTDMAEEGMVNVGQLVREAHGTKDVVAVGFGSYRGDVIAGRQWEAPLERMRVPPARPGSWEHVLHVGAEAEACLLLFEPHLEAMLDPRGHRAIGVVYHPELEHLGNYVPTVLPHRYDAFVFLGTTHALHPLGVPARAEAEPPETYPSGM
jgi:erythromycin esterase-like protein